MPLEVLPTNHLTFRSLLVEPLQGFWNSVVYVLPKLIRYRRDQKQKQQSSRNKLLELHKQNELEARNAMMKHHDAFEAERKQQEPPEEGGGAMAGGENATATGEQNSREGTQGTSDAASSKQAYSPDTSSKKNT